MSYQHLIDRLHRTACMRNENGYIDPKSGFLVLTAKYLSNRGNCCGSGCRHCPYDLEEQSRAGRPTPPPESLVENSSKPPQKR
ncbi:MAG: DUF5522 domain-containing protein [Myxococcota bacterium]